MLKRMRWRFIGSAMSAVICVLTIVIIVINELNAYVIVKQMDSVLIRISAAEESSVSPIETFGVQILPPFTKVSEEETYTTLFFRVDCDADGKSEKVSNDFFTSITDTDAERYAENVMRSGKKKGSYLNFRWLIADGENGKSVYFLNAADQNRMIKIFLYLSCLVELITLVASFVFLWLFSNKAVEPYAKNIERQKQFITDASHEIKTPLTSIATSADILAMSEQNNEWIDNIRKQTSRLTRLVCDLVTLSRLDEAVPFPEKALFSLSDAIWETVEPFISLAKAKHKDLSLNIEEGVSAYGDKSAVQQMISILLDNAVKYSTEGGKINMTMSKRHKRIEIDVSNDCEIKDIKNLNRLFDRFYRIDKSRNTNTGGTGVGLSIAEATAAAHNGKITVRSTDGKTICFHIVL